MRTKLDSSLLARGVHTARTALPLLGSSLVIVSALAVAPTIAMAQQPQPQPPFGGPAQPPAGQPGAGQPGVGQPGMGQPGGNQPGAAPGQFGQPGGPNGGGAAPGQFGAGASFGGGGVDASAQAGGAPATDAKSTTDEWEERGLSLNNQNALNGSTGLLHTNFAGSGAAGTFRVGFMFDWFTSKGFLCDPSRSTAAGAPITCSGKNLQDSASHVGGFFTLSATPFSFLEAYAALRTYANSNDQGSPQLLQVLGDTTIGVKGFTPAKLLGPISAGANLELLLLNGSGDVGLSGGSTSARITALGTADFRNLHKDGHGAIPLRFNLNLGYKIDNSAKAVSAVEQARAAAFKDGRTTEPISRIERFGLGINRVDSFHTNIGVDVPFWFVQPFMEWSIDIPVNRQGYECHTNRVSRGDVCLGLADFTSPTGSGAGAKFVPSRFSIGAKVSPFHKGAFRGLSGTLAFDIGTTGVHNFIEEVAPQAPWTMYLGLGYAFDVKERPVEKAAPPPAPPPVVTPAPQYFVRGFVHETGKQEGIANAIISFQGGAQPPIATGADGRFLTRDLQPGPYTFDVNVPGYKPGTCSALVTAAPAAQPMGQPGMQPGMGQPGQGQPGQPGGSFGGPGNFAPVAPTAPAQTFVDTDCQLEALPRTGNISGTVKDSAGGAVSGAIVTVTDSLGKDQKVTTDGSGSFKFQGLPPGDVTLKGEATGYMNHVAQSDIRPNEETKTTLTMNKKPKNALVKIQGNELKLGDKILFETDSAKILGQSSALLEEIADVLQKNPNLEQIEIQGHTDNSGTRDHNQTLSNARATSVREWLVKAGVGGERLTAKGYGQDRPLAPNVTEANKAKNRRVQFIIVKKR